MKENERHVFIDEEGNKMEFEVIDTFKVDEDEYAVLQPVDEEEAYIYKIENDESGDPYIVEIEDSNEFNEIRDLYLEMLDEE